GRGPARRRRERAAPARRHPPPHRGGGPATGGVLMATVFAVPDVLERFRVGAGDGAEELARRAVSLDVAVGAYLRATERAYAAPCEAAPAAVRAFADALGGLGGW